MNDSVGVAYVDDLGESVAVELIDRKRVRLGATLSSGFAGSCDAIGVNPERSGEVLIGMSNTGAAVRGGSGEIIGIGAEIDADRSDDSDFLEKSILREGLLLGRFKRADPVGEVRLGEDLRAERGVAGVAGNGTGVDMTSVVRGVEGWRDN